ncbi:MAG: DUF4173 domain-containing protein [Clostridiales bacterium]|nr:DUF4173 domain-containing protein [Clostridiales bacterium]
MDNKISFRRAGILLAFPLAYTYARLLLVNSLSGWQLSVALTVISVFFIVVSELVRCGRKSFINKNTGESVFWYIMMILAAVTAPFGPNDVLSVFAVHLCAVYSVLVSNDILLGDKTGGFIPADLIHGFYVKSFAGFPNFVTDWSCFKKEGEKKSRNAAVILLVIGFVILMGIFFVISLVFISRIDVDVAAAFLTYWRSVTYYLERLRIDNIIWSFFLAVPVCFYLYGLMARSAKSDGTREKRIGSNMSAGLEKGRKVPCIVTCISAGFFVVLYIFFFIKRTAYFMGGFTGELPEGKLVAYFAREGFFELVGIMAVNMCVYLTIYLFEKRNNAGRTTIPGRILVTLLMSESIIFAVIAMSKLWLYFSIYGYTPKRMLAMWGTLALGFAALMSIFTVNRGKSHFRMGVFFTAASYIGVSILSWVLGSL